MKFDKDPDAILEEKVYEFVITDYKEKEAVEAGKYPFSLITLEVISPADDEGVKHTEMITHHPNAQGIFKRFITEGCGLQFEIGREYVKEDFVGKRIKALMQHTTFGGTKKAQFKTYFKVDGHTDETEDDFGL